MAEKLKVRSPYDGHLIKEVELDDETRIEQALTTAEELEQKKPLPIPERILILNKTADLVEAKAEEFAMLAAHIVENPMLNGEIIRLDGAARLPAK